MIYERGRSDMTKFYEYAQNNSGGGFDVTNTLCHRLFIEADSEEQANSKAVDLGVYFDGCEADIDCSCCGDRWSETWGAFDLGRINERGYEVCAYEHRGENTEAKWRAQYGRYEVFEEPTWTKRTWRSFSGKIKFRNIEEYVQFLADEYGWTTPDARIFYADGRVVEFNKGGRAE